MIDENLEELYDALDAADSRAYKFSDFEDVLEWDGKTFPYDKEIMFDQKETPACTRYGVTLLSNGANILEWQRHWKDYAQIDPAIIWRRSNKVKTLQAAMDQMKKEKLIKAYLMIDKKWQEGLNQLKKAIDFGLFLYTWSSNWDRTKTWTTKRYVKNKNKFIGHAWGIVWYSDETQEFKCINSFGKERGDQGYFYLPYSLVFTPGFYTIHAIVDVDNSSYFDDSIEKQWAKQIVRDAKKIYENTKNKDVQKKVGGIATFFRTTYKFTDSDL